MSEDICNDCKHFTGYDGVNELWTGCTYGDFEGSKKVCENYDKKTTKTDLRNRIKELEEEKIELMEECACQYRQIQKLESENEELMKKVFLFKKGITIYLQKEKQMKLYNYVDLEMMRSSDKDE